jgi:hypothetical protein
MANYIKIQSHGEIEIEAFTLIGASSKRSDPTKIGFFGSGLKYSIAAMLRNKISFKIFNGENEVIVSTIEKNFRGSVYDAIIINGFETSLTTTMGGKDWDIPFAPIREIYSNAIDEDEDASLTSTDNVEGKIGTTTFFIKKNESVTHFFDNFDAYFCNRNPNVLASNDNVSIYPAVGEGVRLFRKGILCFHDSKERSLFHYNSSSFEINESRVLSNRWGARYAISNGWKKVDNVALIKKLVFGLAGGNDGYFEHKLDFSFAQRFTNAWYDAMKGKKYVPAEVVVFCKPHQLIDRIVLPKSLLIPLYEQFKELDVLGMTADTDGEIDFVVTENPSQILVDKVIEALDVLRNSRYKHRLNSAEIVYVNFINKNTLGKAKNEKIYLSTKLDCEDVSYIAKVLIEKTEHLITDLDDYTRSFQDHFINLYYDELMKKH